MHPRDHHVEKSTVSEVDCIIGDDDGLLITVATEDEAVVRAVYRVPVSTGRIFCVIKDKEYPVLDVATFGLGLEVYDPWEFQVGAKMSGVRIIFPDRVFVVDAEIVHVSPHDGDKIVCGLRVMSSVDTDYAECMGRILTEIKSMVFTSPDSTA